MAIEVRCACGRVGKARDEFAGKRAQCPWCGRVVAVPQLSAGPAGTAEPAEAAGAAAAAVYPGVASFTEYLDPPATPVAVKEKVPVLRRMFEALLDPRSIQWMLILGGGLAVLGLVIWLVSIGVFEDPVVLAVALGIGSLAILGAGWAVVLKSRFRIAGQALTFLGCVVAPLNLWFYHTQGLVTLEGNLWVGGLVCCLLYAATVYVLRDPLFMVAVEAGITLSVGLLLAALRLPWDWANLSVMLTALGLVSLHAERAFPPEAEPFDRKRFGMPLFWSGHVQIAFSLLLLLGLQIVAWLVHPDHKFLEIGWVGNWLTDSPLWAGILWLLGTYAYLYSDLVVRRVGVYTYLAACCFLMAEVTVVGLSLDMAWLIAILALTALAANLVHAFLAVPNEKLSRVVPPLGMALSSIPIVLGVVLHARATSSLVPSAWVQDTGWPFVAVMVLVAASNRVSAWLCRHAAPAWSAVYFFGSAAAAVVAAAGLLRVLDCREWSQQAPWLMLLPIGYLVAGRLWRGHSPERPLGWVAQASTAVILLGVLGASVEWNTADPAAGLLAGRAENLRLGLVFAEAAGFYTLASIFRRRSANLYFAAAAACGALWQFLGYWRVGESYKTMLYAVLGVGFLALCRTLGVEYVVVYRSLGQKALVPRGKGLAAFQAGNAIVSVALLAAFLQGLTRWATGNIDRPLVVGLAWTILAGLAAAGLVPSRAWRRAYVVAAIALGGVFVLTLQMYLPVWRQLEIFSVGMGILLVLASYVGRFRETRETENDMVSIGLWLGSMMTTLPLLIAVVYFRMPGHDISFWDELALFALTLALLVTGLSWQIKSTTFFGGAALTAYLVMVLASLGWRQQVAVGVYLAIGGVLLFACGIALSVYRDKLLMFPERIARREGIFSVLNWR